MSALNTLNFCLHSTERIMMWCSFPACVNALTIQVYITFTLHGKFLPQDYIKKESSKRLFDN